MERDPRDQESLSELYYAGETLIVEYLEYRNEYGFWHRHEWWSIVGHEPEYWEVRCEGSRDATPMMLPGRDDGCALCRNDEAHTVKLHRAVTRVGALTL